MTLEQTMDDVDTEQVDGVEYVIVGCIPDGSQLISNQCEQRGGKDMAWIHVRHSPADYEKWKLVFDETADYKRAHGWKRYLLCAVGGNRNDVIVMEEFDTREHAQEFIDSAYLREAMARGGVRGTPEVLVVEELEEGTS